jgi:hypothetical protein
MTPSSTQLSSCRSAWVCLCGHAHDGSSRPNPHVFVLCAAPCWRQGTCRIYEPSNRTMASGTTWPRRPSSLNQRHPPQRTLRRGQPRQTLMSPRRQSKVAYGRANHSYPNDGGVSTAGKQAATLARLHVAAASERATWAGDCRASERESANDAAGSKHR